jgi:Fur family ferric uptake transcriptional regulator
VLCANTIWPKSSTLRKSYFDKQHDHIIMTDTGEVIEFCDPRIQNQKTIEEIFDIEITNHSLYLYGTKRQNKSLDEKIVPKTKN